MRKNRWLSSLYVWMVMVFLYAPIAVLIIDETIATTSITIND